MTLWSELKSLEEKKNRDLNLCAITLFRSSIFEFSSTRPCFGCENDPLVIFSRLSPNAKQIWVNKATEILERSKSQTWEYLAEEELLEDTNVELFKVCAKSIEHFNAKHQNYATKWELFLGWRLWLRLERRWREYLAEEELLEDTNVELFKVCAKSIERFNAKHQNYATKWELFLVFKLLLEDIYQHYVDLSDVKLQKHLSCAMTLHRNKTMAELLQKNIDVLRQNKTTAELLHQNIGAEKKHFFDVAWRLKLSEEDKKHFFDVAEEICNDVGTATELDWKNLLSYHHLTALDSE
ncbi:hypothetical protein QL285_024870 [Trifolium repens]|nr:hypothetical protein QL285_024870 [Trifolium repens]